jgi:hypothetical protein
MSQHHLSVQHEGVNTHILMGWDRPLQGYFLVIEKDTDEDEPFWSNLIHADEPHPKSIEPFLKVLQDLNINIPDSMIEALEEDGRTNAGNREVMHDPVSL